MNGDIFERALAEKRRQAAELSALSPAILGRAPSFPSWPAPAAPRLAALAAGLFEAQTFALRMLTLNLEALRAGLGLLNRYRPTRAELRRRRQERRGKRRRVRQWMREARR